MANEIKTEDIIQSLRICMDSSSSCSGCAFDNFESPICWYTMENVAADRLEQLNTFDKTQSAKSLGKINALTTEIELLHGALASCSERTDK